MYSHPGSYPLNTVRCIAKSPNDVKDLEGQIELGVICIELQGWNATVLLLFMREGAVYAYSLETVRQTGTEPGESLSTKANARLECFKQ